MSKKAFFNLSLLGCLRGLGAGSKRCFLSGAKAAEQGMNLVVPVEDASAAQRRGQRQVSLRMCRRRVEFCSLWQSLIGSAELMRKIQENIYYKLLLNEADLN